MFSCFLRCSFSLPGLSPLFSHLAPRNRLLLFVPSASLSPFVSIFFTHSEHGRIAIPERKYRERNRPTGSTKQLRSSLIDTFYSCPGSALSGAADALALIISVIRMLDLKRAAYFGGGSDRRINQDDVERSARGGGVSRDIAPTFSKTIIPVNVSLRETRIHASYLGAYARRIYPAHRPIIRCL